MASQFGRPRGFVGRLVGRFMAHGNAPFNKWLVQQVRARSSISVTRIAEIGPGPGIALHELLHTFPDAQVWGVDLSPEMLNQSRRRNLAYVKSGQLKLIQGDITSLKEMAPLDLVLAAHVLYFWHQPTAALSEIHAAVRPGGCLALGYQLRHDMPVVAQRNFPKAGHKLYESDDEVTQMVRDAGFKSVAFAIMGQSDAPEGRLALAVA